MKNTITGDRYRAPALDKGLDILELLAKQPGGMTRAEIVKAMGRGPSEVYRMIERLVARQYVTRSIEGDRYALSMKLFLLGSVHPPLRRVTAYAQPLMDEFARETLQSIHLAAPEAGQVVVIAQASGPANWEFRLRVGAILQLTPTSSGKTLLAFLDDQRRKELLSGQSQNAAAETEVVLQTLHDELKQIKEDGYRISKSGQLVGVTDISVAVTGDDGNAFSVLTCPYMERIQDNEAATDHGDIFSIKDKLLQLAEKLSMS